MYKFGIVLCTLFVAVCVVGGRKCRYRFLGMMCEKQCCGKTNDLKCLDSCENVACSDSDDCGKGCCKNGKCGPPTSHSCSDTIITAVIILSIILPTAIIAGIVWKCCRCKRSTQTDMVILVNQ